MGLGESDEIIDLRTEFPYDLVRESPTTLPDRPDRIPGLFPGFSALICNLLANSRDYLLFIYRLLTVTSQYPVALS